MGQRCGPSQNFPGRVVKLGPQLGAGRPGLKGPPCLGDEGGVLHVAAHRLLELKGLSSCGDQLSPGRNPEWGRPLVQGKARFPL